MLNIPLMSNNINKEDVDALIEFLKTADRFTPVSYTHLDVYKRQVGL